MEEISYAGSSGSGKKRISKRLVIFGGLFLLVLFLLGSAVYFITRGEEAPPPDETANSITLPEENEITETPIPTEEVSLTPEKSTSPSKTPTKSPNSTSTTDDISIAVQNGSGVTGAAAEAANVLKSAGYTIASTGNADASDYTDVTIKVKQSAKASLADIEDALSKDYTIGETTTNLPETTTYDVLIIVGK